MLRLNEFDSSSKQTKKINLKVSSLDNAVLQGGYSDITQSVKFLNNLKDMFRGYSKMSVDVTVNWNGFLTIIVGVNPENDKFFISVGDTISSESVLIYDFEDIHKYVTDEVIKNKLDYALRYLPKLEIDGILKCQILFTQGDIVEEKIDNIEYITIQPEFTKYMIPRNTKLASNMLTSKIGVVFSQSFVGTSLDNLDVSYNVDLSQLQYTKDVWFRDSSITDLSGTVTFNADEFYQFNNILKNLEYQLKLLNPKFVNLLAFTKTYQDKFKKFNDDNVEFNKKIPNTQDLIAKFIKTSEQEFNRYILDAKRLETRQNRIAEKNKIMSFFRSNVSQLNILYDTYNNILSAKTIILDKLRKIKSMEIFVKTENGFKVKSEDGFIVVSKYDGNSMIISDNLSFSLKNMNIQKNWSE